MYAANEQPKTVSLQVLRDALLRLADNHTALADRDAVCELRVSGLDQSTNSKSKISSSLHAIRAKVGGARSTKASNSTSTTPIIEPELKNVLDAVQTFLKNFDQLLQSEVSQRLTAPSQSTNPDVTASVCQALTRSWPLGHTRAQNLLENLNILMQTPEAIQCLLGRLPHSQSPVPKDIGEWAGKFLTLKKLSTSLAHIAAEMQLDELDESVTFLQPADWFQSLDK